MRPIHDAETIELLGWEALNDEPAAATDLDDLDQLRRADCRCRYGERARGLAKAPLGTDVVDSLLDASAIVTVK